MVYPPAEPVQSPLLV